MVLFVAVVALIAVFQIIDTSDDTTHHVRVKRDRAAVTAPASKGADVHADPTNRGG
jgi:hypothetical protein